MNYLSIDVGGTYTKYGLIDRSGNLIETWKEPTANSLEDFKIMIGHQIRTHEDLIEGIAMSCPGRVDPYKSYIHTGGALIFLYDFAIGEWIATLTNLPFVVINDGKAAALAEWWMGNLKGIKNGAVIVLGTGVGGGLILENRLFQGSHFQAGELSFLTYPTSYQQEPQVYGYHGSAVRFIEEAAVLLGATADDYQRVFDVLTEGNNSELSKKFNDYCRGIALLMTNMQVLLDLEKIVIGGGISEQALLIDTVKKNYDLLREESPLLHRTFVPIEIEVCAFRNSSNLLGALYQLLLTVEGKTN